MCLCRGEVADAVVMDRKGYGFVTFADPKNAMDFLEVRTAANSSCHARRQLTQCSVQGGSQTAVGVWPVHYWGHGYPPAVPG